MLSACQLISGDQWVSALSRGTGELAMRCYGGVGVFLVHEVLVVVLMPWSRFGATIQKWRRRPRRKSSCFRCVTSAVPADEWTRSMHETETESRIDSTRLPTCCV